LQSPTNNPTGTLPTSRPAWGRLMDHSGRTDRLPQCKNLVSFDGYPIGDLFSYSTPLNFFFCPKINLSSFTLLMSHSNIVSSIPMVLYNMLLTTPANPPMKKPHSKINIIMPPILSLNFTFNLFSTRKVKLCEMVSVDLSKI